ncbi:ABC transporter substrate-binding protein, partial [Conyzicola sp.]|uniref:ABC transporter substrate-binding protein n=1 Tax=Conyzicola sp. TaxID=1969404 RepID=UPI00398933C9
MNKPIAFVALGLAATLSLAGCASGTGSSSADGSTVEIGSLYEPQNLSNIRGGGQGVTEAFNGNVYEGLFKLTDDGEVEPLLAESNTVSDDGLTYTFTLRDGVTFHSGKELTSADVKASIDAVLAEDSQSARKSSFGSVSSIETPDDTTVVVTLAERSISFIYNLSYVWIINADAVDAETTEDGTGPYTLDEWKRGSSLSLTAFDDYWGDAASNDEVVFTYFTDATALSNALLTNEVDIVTSVQSPDALTQFTDNADYVVSDGESTTKEVLAFNDRVAPFDNVDVRKAVYSAIDTKKLLNSIWGDYGTLIGSMVPPSDPWYEDLTEENPYDPELAKQLLASGGQADGFEFTLDTPSYDPHPAVAEFVKSELAKIGVTVNINTISSDEWYTKVYKAQDFTATLQEHVNDRDVVWYGNPDFYWGYNNPQVTTWVDEAEASATTDEQTEKLKLVNQ